MYLWTLCDLLNFTSGRVWEPICVQSQFRLTQKLRRVQIILIGHSCRSVANYFFTPRFEVCPIAHCDSLLASWTASVVREYRVILSQSMRSLPKKNILSFLALPASCVNSNTPSTPGNLWMHNGIVHTFSYLSRTHRVNAHGALSSMFLALSLLGRKKNTRWEHVRQRNI